MNNRAMITYRAAPFTLAMLLLSVTACNHPGASATAIKCGSLEPRNENEVVLCNELDQAILTPTSMPSGDPPAGGWPGVVLLHGSGGLFAGGDDCEEEISKQYQIWTNLLNARGYAVVMPSSFYSRGFCEWSDRESGDGVFDDEERLVIRVFDAAAAVHWSCDSPQIDCSRIAVMGFSNGASTALMLMNEDLDDADNPRLHTLENIPALVGGVAYYPGCGLNGELANKLADEDIDRYYYPRAPVWVPHAGKDKLAETCEELRDPQVDVIGEQRGVDTDMFELEVYPDAEHGFDNWDEGDRQADFEAQEDARARTLAKLAEWFA